MRIPSIYPAIALVACGLATPTAMARAPETCLAPAERERLLALDKDAFDQDLRGGWRMLADTPGCDAVAADLIRDWRDRHQRTDTILFWHEGQIRADLDPEAAVALFRQSLKPDEPGNRAWNLYAQATIAFITKDRPALQRAHEELLEIAPPDHIEVIDGHYDVEFIDGSKARLRWPPDIDVVEGLVQCFGASYEEAYGKACRDGTQPGP